MVIVMIIVGSALTAGPALAQTTWYAEYFANPTLSGGPVLTRYERELNFDWGGGSPGGGVPADNFSARWTGSFWFDGGTYRFSHRSDDGIRVWVDDLLVVDDWQDQQAAWSFVDQYISRGTHTVQVEYYERTGGARAQVAWRRLSGGDVWRGEYYDNRDLSGAPDLVRYDPEGLAGNPVRPNSGWGIVGLAMVGAAMAMALTAFLRSRCPYCGKWVHPWYWPRRGRYCPKCGQGRS